MDYITVTTAGRVRINDGAPYCELTGHAVRRDGRELAQFASREDADAYAREVAFFVRLAMEAVA